MYLKKWAMATGAIILTFILSNWNCQSVSARPAPLSGFFGEVINTETGKTIPEAAVQIDHEGLKADTTATDEQGKFKWTGYSPGPNWIVSAKVPGFVCLPVLIRSTRYYAHTENIKLYAFRPKPQRVQIVSPSHEPVAGVRLAFTRFKFTYQDYWVDARILGESVEPWATTDENGWATLHGLPVDGIAEITSSHPQFATGIYPLNLLKQEQTTFPLYPPTTITGRVMLGDERPLPNVKLTTGTWKFQGNGVEQRRVVTTDAEGRYRIEDVPPLEVMSRTELPIDMEYGQWQGRNTLLYLSYNGKSEYWLHYRAKPGEGVKYGAGQQIQHDLRFEPMALITGRLSDGEQYKGIHLPFITYNDPRTVTGKGQTIADVDGNFELPVPVGDVTVHFPKRTVKFTNLRPHEIRTVN